ncbi:hypothetical protein [Paenibacillus riograndensis]|uniref:Uncharacterized protein n=1 Tax=Paenibacillus riograndensis SBR5 TaxID=1073571 RepID=A0A0E4HBR3_9BACL|nr:hypothetical protein [Paenibacillus riograndensis]CQR55890.1 hypothetical protein PRIO_3487 [Paenibacillus riograndensis SBR5]
MNMNRLGPYFAFATFHMSSWNEWRAPDQMNPAVLRWVQANQANMKISNMHSKWIINAQHCNLKRLVTDDPAEIKVFDMEESAHRQDYFSNRFQKDLLQVTSNAMELRKSNETIEFLEICPYAYGCSATSNQGASGVFL